MKFTISQTPFTVSNRARCGSFSRAVYYTDNSHRRWLDRVTVELEERRTAIRAANRRWRRLGRLSFQNA